MALIKNNSTDAEKRYADNGDEEKHREESREPVRQFFSIQPFIHGIQDYGKGNAQDQYYPERPEDEKRESKDDKQQNEEEIPFNDFLLHIRQL